MKTKDEVEIREAFIRDPQTGITTDYYIIEDVWIEIVKPLEINPRVFES